LHPRTKLRGVHSTTKLAEAHNSEELFRSAPKTIPIIKDYIRALREREVDPLHLLVQKHLSKIPSEYKKNYLHSIAAKQLSRGGMELNQGETVTFLITDEDNPVPERRILVRELVDEDSSYDAARYEAMLLESASNILSPLGYSVNHLQRRLKFTKTLLHTLEQERV
jgi:DNA polymerase elongation subunit (family B)